MTIFKNNSRITFFELEPVDNNKIRKSRTLCNWCECGQYELKWSIHNKAIQLKTAQYLEIGVKVTKHC